ncbi:MAG TPA: DUF6804 family protein [Thermoanaerobaculia bacterium]|nr:DUF6804 family protein [Thermoanaerobaculia bacterium]
MSTRSRLSVFGSVALAIAMLLAILPESWIYYKILNFVAFSYLVWVGIARISRRQPLFGTLFLVLGTLYYPLIAINLQPRVLVAMDVVGAILLLTSIWYGPSQSESDRYPRYPLFATLLLAAATMLLLLVVTTQSFNSFRDASRQVRHTYQVLSALDEVQSSLSDLESMQRAYVITGDGAVLGPFYATLADLRSALSRTSALARGTAPQRRRFLMLQKAVDEKLAFVRDSIVIRRRDGFEAAQRMVATGRGLALMKNVHSILGETRAEERSLLTLRQEDEVNRSGTATLFLYVGSILSLMLLATVAILIDRDMDSRKEAAVLLQRARDAALESAKLKGDFLANMSHEIRTPMNGIIGMTNLLLESTLEVEQREFAAAVRTSAENLLTIINDILDFSKIEAGKLTIESMDFDLNSTIEGVIDLFTTIARSKGIELLVGVASDIPTALHGDPGRLRQVLTNLIGNALKFTHSGEVRLQIARKDSGASDFLFVRVSDTGIGIPETAQGSLFQAFSQADSSTSRKYGGTGLGLAISRQLVQLMGGEIGCESRPEKGSTFWFTVPLEAAHSPVTGADPIESALHSRRVLVVDRDEERQMTLVRLLSAMGLKPVTEKESSQIAQAVRSYGDIEVIFFDGPEPQQIFRAIRSGLPSLPPVVLLTSSAGQISEEELRRSGVVAEVTKPVHRAALRRALALAVGEQTPQMTFAPVMSRPEDLSASAFRILLAEDNVINQKVALRQLEKLGFKAEAVANGAEAVEATLRFPYDIVLMDCQMPEMDGFEATAAIRAREQSERHTIIIAMTANAMEGDREICLKAGMDDYLSKPLTRELLDATIRKWLVLEKQKQASSS